MKFEFEPIGIIQSCFKEKFGIPRQSGLIPEAEAILTILPPYNRAEAFRDIEGYSHLWLSFVFHAAIRDQWKPTVRPPRLGGNQRVGVFATRSPFRPNPIGLSVVKLIDLDISAQQIKLKLGGVDLLDGTPVLDIKPYVPYSDAIPDAAAGFAPTPPGREIQLNFSRQAESELEKYSAEQVTRLKRLIYQILANNPRPSYLEQEKRNRFGMRLYDFNIIWEVEDDRYWITELSPLSDQPFA
ncbi:MAG: tRNA (N6-threonylcarbamoyladenosine(37)-N6)-methyltransferase TrmO [Candidatus Thiodiazotropha sp. (ex. Lucinisca nassula)]|nr:tRNA (N6-threonylcarbamoyladenosine(37)-N6)-methyltransferase TrmO [Candidatus Thiodiazotropha sp. (ex. Lucinisca nassula)]MBW9269233.1 tRNA (N6-threonylcarbamoyladenosine(37)-N6)-methyltransferase TrmO [Candidatus Thiodiazotropha sp. (ex. Lucinisca nassula)]